VVGGWGGGGWGGGGGGGGGGGASGNADRRAQSSLKGKGVFSICQNCVHYRTELFLFRTELYAVSHEKRVFSRVLT